MILKIPENLMRCPIHLSIGQAVPAVISELASSKDLVVSTHRSCTLHEKGFNYKDDMRALWEENGCSKDRRFYAFNRY